MLNHCERLFASLNRSFQLRILGHCEHFGELRAGWVSRVDQILAVDQQGGPDLLLRQGLKFVASEIVQLERSMAGKAIETMERQVLVKVLQAKEPFQG